jgi:hypothetical protein
VYVIARLFPKIGVQILMQITKREAKNPAKVRFMVHYM